MTRRSRKVWLTLAWIFAVINVGGAVFAAASGEMRHAGLHIVLALVGVWFARRLATRASAPVPAARETEERLDRLQQSLDSIAVEVERIGESQRFMTKVAAERAGKAAANKPPAP